MLIAILIKVGIPFAMLGVGWLAKKWHVQPALQDAFSQGATIALDSAAAKAHSMGRADVAAAIISIKNAEEVTPTIKPK